ncbi:HAD family hydrolase [Vibrio algarum]|uniref:HAD family phosphatase n=1 Tax=Vibrio algarum TaxID=3020714 RepID=A0ABT4YXD1_9VIBR|nr:HAD family phosphatase [Vibrio sp. KJ40-1]MDB1125669.1 HAD family phosphatase [Vibrio sp. KJ40-1]
MKQKQLFIFDMDGVLLDSEPYWRRAQIEMLGQFGISINAEDCIKHTMGKRIDDISLLWINMFKLDANPEQFANQLLEKTALLIRSHAIARDGIYTLIDFLQSNSYRIALATSSSTPIISAVLHKLEIAHVFEIALSADEVDNGKPSPDVYLEVCRRLNTSTKNTIALEDSLTGVRSAVAAQITTIAIPEIVSNDFEIADFVVKNITDVINVLSS